MKYNIAVITALLAVSINLSSAQPKKAEAKTPPTPALAPEPPEPPSPDAASYRQAEDAYSQFVTAFGGQGASRANRALVIPQEAGDPKEFAETEEDLNVMARILEKAASGRDDKHPHAMGIAIQTDIFGSPAVPKNLYIEGHGALFFLNVNFPLLPPATKSSENDSKEKTSTEWEEARRELYQKPGQPGFQFNWKAATVGGPAEEYDADKVEDLKRDVASALKNANHIRKLKSDETVTVVISGRSGSAEPKVFRKSSSGGGSGSNNARSVVAFGRSGGGEGRGTKLIIRARKADIDSFQKDKLSLEDFRKKVTMIVY